MPFQFPDPAVSTTATLPNGEKWEYVDGAWRPVALLDDDQAQLTILDARVDDVEDELDSDNVEIAVIQTQLASNTAANANLTAAINNLSLRLDNVETIDVGNATSLLASIQNDLVALQAHVDTLQLDNWILME